jgi:hypothetical protein
MLPKFTIHPPCTMDDVTGDPTSSLEKDVRRIFNLIEDERHLIAHRLYESVIQRIQEWESLYDIVVPSTTGNTTTTSTETSGATTSTTGAAVDTTTIGNSATATTRNTSDNTAGKRKLFSSSRVSTTIPTGASEYDTKITLVTKKMTKVDKIKFENELKEISKVKRYLDAKNDQITKLEVSFFSNTSQKKTQVNFFLWRASIHVTFFSSCQLTTQTRNFHIFSIFIYSP